MSLRVIDPGIQCTVQAGLRTGYRHAGVPYSGPADPLSMALANRLAGQMASAPCLEISYGPAAFRFEAPMHFAVTGAPALVRLSGEAYEMHATISARSGDLLEIGAASVGARIYLAVSGDIETDAFLGAGSTYLPAAFGGHEGRALVKGDRLAVRNIRSVADTRTPDALRLPFTHGFALRAVPGPDFRNAEDFRTSVYRVTHRLSRMGAEIDGPFPSISEAGLKPSSAVLPGALQVTPQGRGYLLLPDGQTTGGYPHLLQVIRADRHLLGQLRPGDSLRFLLRLQAEAEAALAAKQAFIAAWVPDLRL